MLWPFGICYGHSGYFTTIWYIFSGFGIVHKENSGNPAHRDVTDHPEVAAPPTASATRHADYEDSPHFPRDKSKITVSPTKNQPGSGGSSSINHSANVKVGPGATEPNVDFEFHVKVSISFLWEPGPKTYPDKYLSMIFLRDFHTKS
jgi:hypothetical protein